jgi:hypothetical protein
MTMLIPIVVLCAKLTVMPARGTHPPRLRPIGPFLSSAARIDLRDLPDLAALRAWYAGVPNREAVVHYLPES